MRKKLLLIGSIILMVFTSIALAQADTDTIITDNDTLSGGYFVQYTRDIEYDDTSVVVILSSSEPVEFGCCDEDELLDWNDDTGPYPTWYYNAEDVLSRTMTFILDRGTYDFCILNWGINTASYSINVTITFDPSNASGLGPIWYAIIAIAVVGGIIGIALFARSRRRKEQVYTPSQSYVSSQTNISYQQPTYPSYSYDSQETIGNKPGAEKFCTNCGAPKESNAKFCTNCGSQY